MRKPSTNGPITTRAARSATVEKALKLLMAVAEQPQPVRLLTISQLASLEKTTTHRLATSLTRFGLLRFDPVDRTYSLGLRLAELGNLAIGQLSLPREAHRYLQELGENTEEIVNLGTFEDGAIVFIDQVQSPQSVVIRARVGTRVPAHCTSSGKVLLAFGPNHWLERITASPLKAYTPNTIVRPDEFADHLTRVRRLGYAIDDEEHRLGIRCVAAPVLDHTGLAIASISIAGPAFRLTRERIAEIITPLREAAQTLSIRLGFQTAPADKRVGGAFG
jgi:IclR family acetate operon transcriptional repressor